MNWREMSDGIQPWMTDPMLILNSDPGDIDTLFALYDEAIKYQQKVFGKHWLGFERSLVETEIREHRQWKILVDNQIACIFVISHRDPLIWKEKDNDNSIYIHRIVTNPSFRGQAFVKEIVAWARRYAKETGKGFIRMDTWGDNQKLIDYYVECGFEFLGTTIPEKTNEMPKHYEGISLGLFEIRVD